MDDSTPAVVQEPVDQPAVATSVNRDLVWIQVWCSPWCMLLNRNETTVFVVSRSRTINPLHCRLVFSGVTILTNANLEILRFKFDHKLTFEAHVMVLHLTSREFVF